MKQIRLVLSIAVFLAVLAYTLAFAAHNSSMISINFLAGLEVTMPMALWVGLFFSVGALLAWLITGVRDASQKMKLRKLQKELEESKRRLDRVS
ncbi:MAG: LapA family protein [Saccharospirillaceae bacterium]|nr:hypothetical protein A3759_00440 [Thalassolituus sp. HI0120]MCH2039344.1 LapA family protein [Saccharospirillaceae bacterium]